MALESCAVTDVGLRRTHNEDSYLVSDELGLYLVADGMGGHVAGEVASATAVQAIEQFVRSAENDPDMTWPFGVDDSLSQVENVILSAVKVANQKICQMAIDRPELCGMGTTIAGLKIRGKEMSVFNVGDSRVYLIRNGEVTQLTTDHSWVNEQLRRHMITEEEARTHRWKNVITRALGNKPSIEVDIRSESIQDGDILLICTDGLSGLVPDHTILETVTRNTDNLEQACKELVAKANEAGGHDNITIVIVRYTSD